MRRMRSNGGWRGRRQQRRRHGGGWRTTSVRQIAQRLMTVVRCAVQLPFLLRCGDSRAMAAMVESVQGVRVSE